jgi:hypothetical protein
VSLQLVSLAKKNFHRFRRQMAMARADVHHERVRRSRSMRQWLAQPGINGLSNQVLNYSTMWR